MHTCTLVHRSRNLSSYTHECAAHPEVPRQGQRRLDVQQILGNMRQCASRRRCRVLPRLGELARGQMRCRVRLNAEVLEDIEIAHRSGRHNHCPNWVCACCRDPKAPDAKASSDQSAPTSGQRQASGALNLRIALGPLRGLGQIRLDLPDKARLCTEPACVGRTRRAISAPQTHATHA